MNKNLILTGWGRADYAVAAAVALEAACEARRGDALIGGSYDCALS